MDQRRVPPTSAARQFDDAELARRFQRRLRTVAPATGRAGAHVYYDESGYPIERGPVGLAERVRRLITG